MRHYFDELTALKGPCVCLGIRYFSGTNITLTGKFAKLSKFTCGPAFQQGFRVGTRWPIWCCRDRQHLQIYNLCDSGFTENRSSAAVLYNGIPRIEHSRCEGTTPQGNSEIVSCELIDDLERYSIDGYDILA